MEKMVNSINWVEIPVLNFDRAKKFYSKIYEYDMYEETIAGCRMGFLPMDRESRGVGGAIIQGHGYVPSSLGSRVYLNGGQNLQIVLSRVEGVGGEVLVNKTKISDEIGYYAVFEDTEGNHVALHSPE